MTTMLFYRYDYENCESEGAEQMMAHFQSLINDQSLVSQSFTDGAVTYTVQYNDNFEYKDPIDGSVTSKQVHIPITLP